MLTLNKNTRYAQLLRSYSQERLVATIQQDREAVRALDTNNPEMSYDALYYANEMSCCLRELNYRKEIVAAYPVDCYN